MGIKMYTATSPPHQEVMVKEATVSLKQSMLVDKEERARLHMEGIDHVVHEAEEGERSLNSQHRLVATKKPRVKQALGARRPLITKENGEKQKSRTSCVQDFDLPGPSSKRAGRSTEVRTSCPWEVDPTSQQIESPFKAKWRTSEELRKSGRPTNVKGSKMIPIGPLRCYAREMIKVEQGWAREVGESGRYIGGFIDDVVDGERLVVDRPVKEFAYFTLRQGTQGVLEGSHHVEADEIPLMNLNQGHVDSGRDDQRSGE